MTCQAPRYARRWPAARFAALAVLLIAAEAAAGAPDVPPIVFVSRGPVLRADGERVPGAIPGIGPRDRAAAVGGRLVVREPDGSLRTLVNAPALFDVADPCVSWDARRILFSGLAHPDSGWRIYEIGADGAGLRAVTRSDRDVALSPLGGAAARFVRYDDIDPCWLPSGRIAFASTRFPCVAEVDDHAATNLFVIEPDGTCLHRITSDRSGAEEPAVDPITGRIVYARWWVNRDRPSNATRDGITTRDDEALTDDVGNIWHAISVNPDGSALKLHAGDPRTRAGSVAYKPALLDDGRVLALFGENGSFSPCPGATGVRLFAPGADTGRVLAGAAADASPLPGGRVVLSTVAAGASDFGLAVCRLDGSRLAPLVDLPGTHELDAAPIVARAVPPVLPDGFDPENSDLPPTEDPATYGDLVHTFRFDCLNVFANGPVDAPMPDAPPIARDVRIRFFTNFQRQNPTGRDPAILWRVADLSARGAVAEHDIPSDVPLFEQLVDGDGKVIVGKNGKAAHVSGLNFARMGEGVKCVGCHAGHSLLPTTRNYSAAEWFNASTSATVTATSAWTPEGTAAPVGPPERLVDRRARHDSLGVAWVAEGRDVEAATLTWPIPIEVKQFVLYGVRPNRRTGTDIRVESCRISLYRGGILVGQISDSGRVRPDGTEIAVPPTVIDSAEIEIRELRGRVAGARRAALAEVETIARIAED